MSQGTPEIYTSRPWEGSAVLPLIKAALTALVSCHAGVSGPAYATYGTLWLDTGNDELMFYDGGQWITVASIDTTDHEIIPYSRGVPLDVQEIALTAGDSTPDMSMGQRFKTADTSANEITTIDGSPPAGHVVTLRATNGNTTINGALTKTGMTVPLVAGDVLMWLYDGSSWQQIAGSVGMGRFVLVDEDAIGDWISSSVTSYTDVDLSDDGVREGAAAALIAFGGYSSSGNMEPLHLRKNGSSLAIRTALTISTSVQGATVMVQLDDDAVFEAQWRASWTAGANEAVVLGYWI